MTLRNITFLWILPIFPVKCYWSCQMWVLFNHSFLTWSHLRPICIESNEMKPGLDVIMGWKKSFKVVWMEALMYKIFRLSWQVKTVWLFFPLETPVTAGSCRVMGGAPCCWGWVWGAGKKGCVFTANGALWVTVERAFPNWWVQTRLPRSPLQQGDTHR